MVAEWLKHWPVDQRVTVLIPGQGYVVWVVGSLPGLVGRQLAHQCFSLLLSHINVSLSCSLPTLPSYSLKKISEKITLGEY